VFITWKETQGKNAPAPPSMPTRSKIKEKDPLGTLGLEHRKPAARKDIKKWGPADQVITLFRVRVAIRDSVFFPGSPQGLLGIRGPSNLYARLRPLVIVRARDQ